MNGAYYRIAGSGRKTRASRNRTQHLSGDFSRCVSHSFSANFRNNRPLWKFLRSRVFGNLMAIGDASAGYGQQNVRRDALPTMQAEPRCANAFEVECHQHGF